MLIDVGELGGAAGTLVAMAVIYRPNWVMSFDDRLYLAKEQ